MTATRNRYFVVTLAAILAMLAAHSTALAADDGFDKLVKHLKTNYHAKQKKIPFLGVANFFVKIVQPKGVKGFKVAIFEDQDFSPRPGETEFGRVMRGALNEKWQPVIQSSLQRGQDRTYAYVQYLGKDIKLMVAVIRPRQAIMAEVKLDPVTLIEWLQKPGGIAEGLFGNWGGNTYDYARRDDDQAAPHSDANGVEIAPSPRAPRPRPVLVRGSSGGDASLEAASAGAASAGGAGDEAESTAIHRASSTGAERDAASDEEAVKLQARMIHLNVKATDQAGKIITDLRKEDFAVFEDGAEQEVSYFEPITAPVNLVLLLDLSGSTKDKVKVIKDAAKNFVDSLNPGDSIAVATFTSKFYLVSNFTTDRKLLKERIERIKKTSSGTNYYDAMWTTLDLLGQIKERRKAVVVLTDGVDNAILRPERYPDRRTFEELMMRLAEDEATVYPIYLDTEYEVVVKRGDGSHEEYAEARKQLEQVAEQSGGALFRAARAEDLKGVYQKVASELRTFYSVAYAPKNGDNDGRWRKISIRVNREKATARTKRGYYAR